MEGRYLHGEGGKQWFQGKIAAINRNGTFAISYHDGDYEGSVRRENIRTKADKERPNPQLADFKRRRVKQSFASSLSPAHGGSASPGPKTTPAQAACQASIENEAKATGAKEAEAARKQAEESIVAETQVAVKEEPVEEYDWSYACLICGESVRGIEALKCSHWQCQSNPLHRACITNPQWLRECPTCKRQTMEPWSGAGGRHAAAVATIDLTTGGGKGHQCKRRAASPCEGDVAAKRARAAADLAPVPRWLWDDGEGMADEEATILQEETKTARCDICVSFGVGRGSLDNGAAAGGSSQGSTGRTPQKTDRYTPEAGKKRKATVSAVATVVADTGLSYWEHLERAKSALDKGIITQEDYDDLKQHYMKKLKEM